MKNVRELVQFHNTSIVIIIIIIIIIPNSTTGTQGGREENEDEKEEEYYYSDVDGCVYIPTKRAIIERELGTSIYIKKKKNTPSSSRDISLYTHTRAHSRPTLYHSDIYHIVILYHYYYTFNNKHIYLYIHVYIV